MTSTFSTSAEEAIARRIDVVVEGGVDSADLEAYYEVERTVRDIVEGGYLRIALQFPDELLRDSVPIYRSLKRRLGSGRELYILADTSYGSCCVDEVAAQHVNADAMIHYGHACLSQTSRLPVSYVFGRKSLDIDDCISKLTAEFELLPPSDAPQTILLRHDVVYTHLADEILQRLQAYFSPRDIPVVYHKIPTHTLPSTTTPALKSAPSATSTPPTILYIGPETLTLTNLLMTHSTCNIIAYNPETTQPFHPSSKSNRLLMRRYTSVQKARDADVFGILVGTLGVASYLPLITHLRALLKKKQKKSYTISVGKLNPAKLANFLEVDCFVLVACAENSLIEDKEFLRPIVTPYELEVALRAEQSWMGGYVLDFEKVIEGLEEQEKEKREGDDDDDDEPSFSLITGTYRHAKKYGAEPPQSQTGTETSLILRNKDDALSQIGSAAGQFLQRRTYQGLEQRLGLDEPGILEQGRSGIARGYQDDRSHQNIE